MVASVRHMTLLLALTLVVSRFARADERPIESDSVWRSIPAGAATRWVPRPVAQRRPDDGGAVQTTLPKLPASAAKAGSFGNEQTRAHVGPVRIATTERGSALAPESAPPVETFLPKAGEITRLAGGTLIAVVVGVLALVLLRRSRWGTARAIRNSSLQHGGSIPLGARNSLHLVTVGEQRFLVAVDPRGVSSIAAVAESFPEFHEALGEASTTDAPERSVLPFAKRA